MSPKRLAVEGNEPPLLRKVDCIRIPVPDLEAGLAFYRDKLGHDLEWRTETAAGLRMPESDAEIVVHTERPGLEVDFLVDSADAAAEVWVQAGGLLLAGPFDIQIGRCAVVADPWGSVIVLLDMKRGPLLADEAGNVIGNDLAEPG
jgi:predicted enzyme related to lactoylglutathione lyase